MNVSLTPELEKFVHDEVGNGLYQTASEVVRAGVRRLKEDREARSPRIPKTREELTSRLLEAAASLDAGEGIDAGEAFAQLHKSSKARRRNG